MRFHVDAWDPSYGSSVETVEGTQGVDSTARINYDVELAAGSWRPLDASGVAEPSAVVFADGVRRIEARIWIDQPPYVDPTTGWVADTGDAVMALCASYAAGAVWCREGGRAHVASVETRRGLFTTATNATDVATRAGVYAVSITPDDPDQNLGVLLSEALQRRLGELELIVAVKARISLALDGVDVERDLLVIDGPLRGRTHLPRALGYIKSHRAAYLKPDLHAMVGSLQAGERTPVFLMGTSWDRHSWYLRLPCLPGGPWAGVVRVECSADMRASDAIRLATLSQQMLPRYASCEYKDTRAPQNLVPVAGLERELRRRLGNPMLLARALRIAAARTSN